MPVKTEPDQQQETVNRKTLSDTVRSKSLMTPDLDFKMQLKYKQICSQGITFWNMTWFNSSLGGHLMEGTKGVYFWEDWTRHLTAIATVRYIGN